MTQDPQALFRQAVAFHQAGQQAEAEALYQQLIATLPMAAEPRHMLGILRMQQGRGAEAAELIGAAVKINPHHPEMLAGCANVLRGLGRPDEALQALNQALTLKPDFVQALFARGNLVMETRPDDALKDFDKALALKPDFIEAWNNRADALSRLGRLEEAQASFDKAISLRPDFAASHYNRAVMLQRAGRQEEALASYDRALAARPDYFEALFNRGILLLGMRRDADALAAADRCISLRPDSAESWNNRGSALRNLKQIDKALECFNRSLALRPDYEVAHCNRGSLLIDELRQPGEALENFDKAIALRPDFAEAWNNRGNALRELGRLEDAHGSYEKALSLNPAYADAEKSRGQVLFELDRIPEAISFFQAVAARRSARSPFPAPGPAHRLKHDEEQQAYQQQPGSGEKAGARLTGPAVRLNENIAGISQAWRTQKPQIAVIDNLLTPQALDGLRRFCLEEPMWRANYPGGYLGAFPEDGFAAPLLGQIADELRKAYPAIFQNHTLNYMWGFKYDSRLSGIAIHADQAAVNVNFWITPDEANQDPESGGLLVWDVAAPMEWDFGKFNADTAAIRQFLNQQGAKPIRIPYRQNRAVIFDSDLFHETDTIRFKPGYLNRRINVTMLYGRRRAGPS